MKNTLDRLHPVLEHAFRAFHACKQRVARCLTPSEFIIAPPVLPAAWSARLEALLRQPSTPASVPDPDALRALGDMAVFLWRLQKRAAQSDPPLDRKLTRIIDLAGDSLAQAGCVIKDYTGERYVSGMAIDVRTFQPLPGITLETVAETLRPGVFFKSQPIVRGDIIVNTPLRDAFPAASDPAPPAAFPPSNTPPPSTP